MVPHLAYKGKFFAVENVMAPKSRIALDLSGLDDLPPDEDPATYTKFRDALLEDGLDTLREACQRPNWRIFST